MIRALWLIVALTATFLVPSPGMAQAGLEKPWPTVHKLEKYSKEVIKIIEKKPSRGQCIQIRNDAKKYWMANKARIQKLHKRIRTEAGGLPPNKRKEFKKNYAGWRWMTSGLPKEFEKRCPPQTKDVRKVIKNILDAGVH